MLQMFSSYVAARMAEKEEGQGLVEYALIIALIAVAAIGALVVLEGNISSLLEGISFGSGS